MNFVGRMNSHSLRAIGLALTVAMVIAAGVVSALDMANMIDYSNTYVRTGFLFCSVLSATSGLLTVIGTLMCE